MHGFAVRNEGLGMNILTGCGLVFTYQEIDFRREGLPRRSADDAEARAPCDEKE